MYKLLIRLPPSACVFLSGLLISVATSAAAQVAFAERTASNQSQVISSGSLAFVAGLIWFALSELIASALRHIETMTPVLKNRDAAIAGLPPRHKLAMVTAFSSALAISFVWPWIGSAFSSQQSEPVSSAIVEHQSAPPVRPPPVSNLRK